MGDAQARADFPDRDQRFAVCNRQWRGRNKEQDAMDTKTLDFSAEFKALGDGEATGTFEGYASVFGDKDVVDDIVQRGAFRRTLREHRAKKRLPALLWQHDTREPIGVWLELKEDRTGLYGKGRLFVDDIPRARQAHALLRSNGLSGLSIGYRTVESKIDEKNKTRTLLDVELFEVSLVTFPALDSARVSDVKAVTSFGDLPLADRDRSWDAGAAERRVRAWADAEEEPNERYRRGFVLVTGDTDNFGSYKLGIADVIDGRLTAVPRGIFAAAAVLSGARGGINASESEKAGARRHISRYYQKMQEAFDDESIMPPWDKAYDGDFESAVKDVLLGARDVTLSKRDCETFLRDVGGFSQSEAKAFMADGYSGLTHRDGGEDAIPWSDEMRERIRALAG